MFTFVFFDADPENSMYDALSLNRGIQTMVTMATSFAFLDRFVKPDGMTELFQVLSKWKDGTFWLSYAPVLQFRVTNG